MSNIPRVIPAGLYRHYKGELYLLLGVAHHSETMERIAVYVPLYIDPSWSGTDLTDRMTVRPAEMFFGIVDEYHKKCGGTHTTKHWEGDLFSRIWFCFDCEQYYTPSVKRFEYVGEMDTRA